MGRMDRIDKLEKEVEEFKNEFAEFRIQVANMFDAQRKANDFVSGKVINPFKPSLNWRADIGIDKWIKREY